MQCGLLSTALRLASAALTRAVSGARSSASIADRTSGVIVAIVVMKRDAESSVAAGAVEAVRCRARCGRAVCRGRATVVALVVMRLRQVSC